MAGCVYLSVLTNKGNKQLNVTLVVCFILLGKISKGQNNYGFCVCILYVCVYSMYFSILFDISVDSKATVIPALRPP